MEEKEKKLKDDEKDEKELTDNEQTNAMKEMQKGYEKQIAQLKEHYEEQLKNKDIEHNKQIRNIMLGKNLIKDDDEDDDDEDEINKIIENINKGR